MNGHPAGQLVGFLAMFDMCGKSEIGHEAEVRAWVSLKDMPGTCGGQSDCEGEERARSWSRKTGFTPSRTTLPRRILAADPAGPMSVPVSTVGVSFSEWLLAACSRLDLTPPLDTERGRCTSCCLIDVAPYEPGPCGEEMPVLLRALRGGGLVHEAADPGVDVVEVRGHLAVRPGRGGHT